MKLEQLKDSGMIWDNMFVLRCKCYNTHFDNIYISEYLGKDLRPDDLLAIIIKYDKIFYTEMISKTCFNDLSESDFIDYIINVYKEKVKSIIKNK